MRDGKRERVARKDPAKYADQVASTSWLAFGEDTPLSAIRQKMDDAQFSYFQRIIA